VKQTIDTGVVWVILHKKHGCYNIKKAAKENTGNHE
jgi:hypothetical protein